jgi:hypothetical protein
MTSVTAYFQHFMISRPTDAIVKNDSRIPLFVETDNQIRFKILKLQFLGLIVYIDMLYPRSLTVLPLEK